MYVQCPAECLAFKDAQQSFAREKMSQKTLKCQILIIFELSSILYYPNLTFLPLEEIIRIGNSLIILEKIHKVRKSELIKHEPKNI